MKTYTEVLINKVPGGSKWYKADPDIGVMHYEARHKTDNVYIMWMETRMVRRLCTLPCVLIENGEAMVFVSSSNFATAQDNAKLLKRWSLYVTPHNIDSEWDVTFMEKEDFQKKYKAIQNGDLCGEAPAPEATDEEIAEIEAQTEEIIEE